MLAPNAPREAPHIRLNSAQSDLTDGSSNNKATVPPRLDLSGGRSLIPQRPPASPLNNPFSPPVTYGSGPAESAELLLPPSRSRTHRFRDDDASARGSPDAAGFRSPSGFSSRRTSWSSEGGHRDSRGYSTNPFGDSRAPSRAGSDEDNVNTQTVSEKYNILPSAGLLLFPEDVEKDDWLHNPDPNDKEKDCDIFTKRGMVNVGGLVFITLGVLVLFIGYPVMYVPCTCLAFAQPVVHFEFRPQYGIKNSWLVLLIKICIEPGSRNTRIRQTRALRIRTASTLEIFHFSRIFGPVS